MLILLIGPPAVGKTTLGEAVANDLDHCRFCALDARIANKEHQPVTEVLRALGREKFYDLSRRVIQQIEREYPPNEVCVVDIGAGTLQSHRAIELVKTYETICIYAPAEEVYKRDKLREKRSFDQFKRTEYSARHRQLYEAARHKVDISGLEESEAKKTLRNKLIDIVVQSRRVEPKDPEATETSPLESGPDFSHKS